MASGPGSSSAWGRNKSWNHFSKKGRSNQPLLLWWKWHPVLQQRFVQQGSPFGPFVVHAVYKPSLLYNMNGGAAFPSAEQQNITVIQLFVLLTNLSGYLTLLLKSNFSVHVLSAKFVSCVCGRGALRKRGLRGFAHLVLLSC